MVAHGLRILNYSLADGSGREREGGRVTERETERERTEDREMERKAKREGNPLSSIFTSVHHGWVGEEEGEKNLLSSTRSHGIASIT